MRLIDAVELLKKMLREGDKYNNEDIRHGYHNCQLLVYDAPTIDAEPVRHGRWFGEYDGYADGNPVYDVWSCRECGHVFEEWDEEPDWNYCPMCGAKMRW